MQIHSTEAFDPLSAYLTNQPPAATQAMSTATSTACRGPSPLVHLAVPASFANASSAFRIPTPQSNIQVPTPRAPVLNHAPQLAPSLTTVYTPSVPLAANNHL